MKILEAGNRAKWRTWLASNHDKKAEIWLVFHSKKTGKQCVEYGASGGRRLFENLREPGPQFRIDKVLDGPTHLRGCEGRTGDRF